MREHLGIFRKNGFEIEISEEEAEPTAVQWNEDDRQHEAQHSSHRRIRVKSLPFSKNITFGTDDINELCALLAESPGVMVRLPKVTAMFASRACRSSVMIGTALNRAKMTTIVRHMAELVHPWACPHGRPTMRHLFNLSQLRPKVDGEPLQHCLAIPFAAADQDDEEMPTAAPVPHCVSASVASTCCSH